MALTVAALLWGCGPKVEEEDDFVEQRCAAWCDETDSCEHSELTWDECFSDCFESESWTDECREPRAVYLDCLGSLSCEELEARVEAVLNGEELPTDACEEEAFEAAACRSR